MFNRVQITQLISHANLRLIYRSTYKFYEYFLGDASEEASVICRTLQGSAHIEEDFMERTNTEMYRISFGPGETEKPCEGKRSFLDIIYLKKTNCSVEKFVLTFLTKSQLISYVNSNFFVDKTVNECQQK